MLAQFKATIVAVRAAAKVLKVSVRITAAIMAAFTFGGCTPTIGQSTAGADPADLKIRVDGVVYRSTVTPYSSLRPASPLPWREQNNSAAPLPKTDQ